MSLSIQFLASMGRRIRLGLGDLWGLREMGMSGLGLRRRGRCILLSFAVVFVGVEEFFVLDEIVLGS